MLYKLTRRPVLSIVISIMIVFIGLLSIKRLPISQFPQVAPPRVNVFVAFPGASAEVLIKSTLIPLEQAINGVPGMRYMVGDATSAGEGTIRVIFEPGTDPNAAMVRVKARIDKVMQRVPPLVRLEGVILRRVQPSMLMYVNIYSTDKHADEKFLYNYTQVHVVPEIKRIRGIAQARILGSRRYAMRIWLNPDRMRAYHVSTEEVMDALAEQSVIGRPGRLGRSSGIKAQSTELVLSYRGRFNTREEYENVIIRATEEGEYLRLKDVAKIGLGSEFFDIYSNLDGHPSAAIVLKQSPGSNARAVIADVKAKIRELQAAFPPGMKTKISYDVARFLDASIEKVLHTLFEAFVLVSLVVFIFLGDWRSTLIPVLAVPVSLVGSFGVVAAFGLSLNLITLFALVLAIGIVVDDAIVVVEAVHAKMEQRPELTVPQAVRAVLGEIAGAVVAITLVMSSVFIPIAFIPGPVGVFYRQFSITMSSSIVLSGLIALTLTPILCILILKKHGAHDHSKRKFAPIRRFLDAFDRLFERFTGRYVGMLRRIATRRLFTCLIFIGFAVNLIIARQSLPTGFIPNEDQGMIYAVIQTPPGTTLERTNAVSRELQKIAEKVEGVASVSALAGYEVVTQGRGSNAGTCLINLEPWEEREHSAREIMEELEERVTKIGAVIEFFGPPAVPGFGTSGGLAFRLLDKHPEVDYQEFDRVNKKFMAALKKRPELKNLLTFYMANFPQYELKIDGKKAMQKGVTVKQALDNLSILIASTYEQGFIRFGRFFKLYVQGSPEFRRGVRDFKRIFVKNEKGEMVPYSAFMELKKTVGPNEITRYNLYTSSPIRANKGAGYTTGDAIQAIREVAAATLPKGYDIAWEGLTYDQAQRGNEALYIFLVVLGFVYLILSAQYESFVLPLIIIVSLVPGIAGAFLFLKMMGLANDIYAQIGLIMLVGLLGKNAILIVEFAVQAREKGASLLDATLEGGRVRLRAILMTSFAFIAGLIPLVRATGAGAIGSRTIGSSAFGGMLAGTMFGIFLIPGLYYLFGGIARAGRLQEDEDFDPLSEQFDHSQLAYEQKEPRAEHEEDGGAEHEEKGEK